MSAISAGNLTLLRTTRHATKLGLVVYAPPAIWTAQVNGTQGTGARSIVVDNEVEVRTPHENYLVLFGTTAGARDLGDARFQLYSSILHILTVSAHNAVLTNNVYITIVEEVKPSAIHPAISSTDVVYEDGLTAYGGSSNIQYSPLARCGSHAVAYLDRVTGLATINFYGRGTAVATGATLTTHAWVWRGGTVTAGGTNQQGTSGSPNTVTWNTAGDYYCSYTVTDSNSKTHVRYFVVFIRAYNATNVYTSLALNNMLGNVESGVWSTDIEVKTTATTATFPNNALCTIFAEDWYGETQQSIGQELYRENIVLVGYIREGSIKVDALKSSVSFKIESVSGVMANLRQLAGTLSSTTGTPSGWHQLQNMTYNLAAHHILTRHSTITQIADTYLSLPTYLRNEIDLQDSGLAGQLQNIIAAAHGRMGCSPQGSLYLEVNPQLQAVASRSTTYVLSTTYADLRGELDFGEEIQEKPVSQVDFAGEDAAAIPIFSLAPEIPWSPGRSEKVNGIRVDTQTESNALAGIFEGQLNNSFANVVIPWRGDYRVFGLFPAEPIRVTIAASDNVRGIAWTNQRCWIKQVNYTYRPGVLLVSTTVEKDAVPSTGITGEYPTEPPIPPYRPPDPPDPPGPPPEPPPVIPPGKGNLLYVTSNNKGVAKCVGAYGTDGTDGTPVWTAVNTGLTGNALKIRGFNLDPWSISGDHFTAAWAMTDNGLYRCTGLPDAETWTQKLSNADAATLIGASAGGETLSAHTLCYSFTPSVLLSGFIGILVRATGSTSPHYFYFFVYSLDNGATWACNTADWIISYAGALNDPTCGCSFHLANTFYITGRSDRDDEYPGEYAFNANPFLHRSTTIPPNFHGVQCFGSVASGGFDSYTGDTQVIWPYCDATGKVYADDSRMYTFRTAWGNTPNNIRKYVAAMNPLWNNTPTVHPVGTGVAPSDATWTLAGISNVPLAVSAFDEDIMVCFGKSQTNAGGDGYQLWVSSNGALTWTKRDRPAPGGRQAGTPKNLFMLLVDPNILFMTTQAVASGIALPVMTTDFGQTWVDISRQGQADGIDTVLGLVNGDFDEPFIFVDYYKP